MTVALVADGNDQLHGFPERKASGDDADLEFRIQRTAAEIGPRDLPNLPQNRQDRLSRRTGREFMAHPVRQFNQFAQHLAAQRSGQFGRGCGMAKCL